jgi:hypothetical protein
MEVINKVIQEMEELTDDIGPKISVDKRKYMNTSKHKHKYIQPKIQNINQEEYQEISEFKYLVLLFTYDTDCGKDVQQE